MNNHDKALVGTIEDVLKDISSEKGIRLDKDKLEFLKMISKTKYSGLPTPKLVSTMNALKDKNDDWFGEILADGLAEQLNYQTPTSKVRQTFNGWFITSEGRKLLKEIINKM
ncbi:MAG: hypothetical protein K0R18_187 [Bacillales bacterium]|jgi:hypothetical protein|nr:hypothetical protein [Bacillales bacterium]